jgi:heat shock protein HslJ
MQLFHRTSAVFFALGLFIALCSSCSSEKKDPAADGSDAAEPFLALDFILESSEGFAPVEGSTIRLSFREGDTSELGFALHGGCNSLLGDFTLADGVMSVSQLMMTEMACGGGLMEQDNWLVGFMTASPSYVYSDSRLTLTGTEATLVFLDRELADPDRSLVGPTWSIDNYLEGMTSTAVNLTTRPTVTFGEDGQVSVETGCNTGGGSYTVEGNTITLSLIGYTRMLCDDEDAAWAEAHIQSVLNEGEVTYEIDANRLGLTGAEKGLGATTD